MVKIIIKQEDERMGKEEEIRELKGKIASAKTEIEKAISALSSQDILPAGREYWEKALPVFKEEKLMLEEEMRKITMHHG
ncbi:MAG: hypothetical protein Q7T34_02410 [Candidatus Parcubacteria bacterium]|nr:hypothetical protein [Candidatus Parcubacteria bacterium]